MSATGRIKRCAVPNRRSDDIRLPLLAAKAAAVAVYFTVLAMVILLQANPTPASAHVPGCHTKRCDVREGRSWAARHQQLGPIEEHRATVYSGECDGQSNVMSDETRINASGSLSLKGEPVDIHALASSFIPTGTKIKFEDVVFGSRYWTVRDGGGEFDLYRPNCNYTGWPGLTNPTLRFRRVLK